MMILIQFFSILPFMFSTKWPALWIKFSILLFRFSTKWPTLLILFSVFYVFHEVACIMAWCDSSELASSFLCKFPREKTFFVNLFIFVGVTKLSLLDIYVSNTMKHFSYVFSELSNTEQLLEQKCSTQAEWDSH